MASKAAKDKGGEPLSGWVAPLQADRASALSCSQWSCLRRRYTHIRQTRWWLRQELGTQCPVHSAWGAWARRSSCSHLLPSLFFLLLDRGFTRREIGPVSPRFYCPVLTYWVAQAAGWEASPMVLCSGEGWDCWEVTGEWAGQGQLARKGQGSTVPAPGQVVPVGCGRLWHSLPSGYLVPPLTCVGELLTS